MRPYKDTGTKSMKVLRASEPGLSQDFPFKVRGEFFHLVPSTEVSTGSRGSKFYILIYQLGSSQESLML